MFRWLPLALLCLRVWSLGAEGKTEKRDWGFFFSASFGYTHYQAKELNDVMYALEAQSADAAGLNHYSVGTFNGHPRQSAIFGMYWRHWQLGLEAEFWVERFSQDDVPFYLNRDQDSRFTEGEDISCDELRAEGFAPVAGGTAGCIDAEEKFTLIPLTLQLERLFPFWNDHLWLGVGGAAGVLLGDASITVMTDFIGDGSRPDDTLEITLYPGINSVFKAFGEISFRPWHWVGFSLKGGYRWSGMRYVEISKKKGDSFLFSLILSNDSLEQGDRAYLLSNGDKNTLMLGEPTDTQKSQAALSGNRYNLVQGDFSGWMLEAKVDVFW
ncbi:MAG TPA: hypothetical protein VLM37_08270 [Fibrobacteraceae bacterium]|nr:hypothetical protein [Fibrobacteraceae bacterium]